MLLIFNESNDFKFANQCRYIRVLYICYVNKIKHHCILCGLSSIFPTCIWRNEIARLSTRNATGDADIIFKKVNTSDVMGKTLRSNNFGNCWILESSDPRIESAPNQEVKNPSEYQIWQTQFLLVLNTYNETRKHYMENGPYELACKPVMTTRARRRPCAGKAGFAKRSWWCLGIILSSRCCQFSMISKILEEIYI